VSRLVDAYEAVADAEIEHPDQPGHSALDNERRVEALGLGIEEFLHVALKMARVARVRGPSLPEVELFLLGIEIGRELMRQEGGEAARGTA
jgi:hypothetical protein